MSKRLIDLQHISKSYDGQMVLDDLNLYIRENEFLTLLGPSGWGKLPHCGLLAVLRRLMRETSSLTARTSPILPPTSGN